MTDLNKVILIGRVTRDISEENFGYVGNGTARLNLSIACNRSVKKADAWENEASFFEITVWGKQAESLKPYLSKGKQIAVEGFLKQDRWEKDGQKFSKISITANNIQLIGSEIGGKKESASLPKEVGFIADNLKGTVVSTPSDSEFPEDIPF